MSMRMKKRQERWIFHSPKEARKRKVPSPIP
jgi:hypothetical protein